MTKLDSRQIVSDMMPGSIGIAADGAGADCNDSV